ncbi:MAG: Vitamin B12 dependent methionine synthase activation subunit, partial [Candidatus Abyssubacteria bacterium]|nr:Vitamin B12 dependent methionine synthase activation subunit [Candidatus Abyssubacteria bacterium]
DVNGQRPVFSLLDPSPIGVSLNDHCMMTPKKSVSFVIPLVEGKAQREEGRRCEDCGYVDCSYRRK